MKNTSTAVIVLFLTWILFGGLGYIVGYLSLGQERVQYLANHGATTIGRVDAKQPNNHQAIVYSYEVDNIRYTGIGRGGIGNFAFDDIGIGQDVTLVYDPKSPSDSYLGDPRLMLELNESTINRLMLVIPIVPSFIVIFVAIAMNRSRNGAVE